MQFQKSGVRGYGGQLRTPSNSINQNSYIEKVTGAWRHNLMLNTPSVGTGALLANEYLMFTMLQFFRTYAPGVTNDVPPTPTNSNNYQSVSVFNGSYIDDFEAILKLQNTAAEAHILDIYSIELSFFDGLIWNTVQPANCLVTFSTAGGAGSQQGVVSPKAMTATLLTDNIYRSFKLIQKYMRKIGQITLGNVDSTNEIAEIVFNEIPEKCRRSQTGMFWGIVVHNPTEINAGKTTSLIATLDINFTEHPADSRMPYLY